MIPEGIVDTLWFDVEERCREFGDEFDVWQDGLGQVVLGIRADGTWAATVGGITLSIPRQVAKTFIVGRIVVALCTMFPDLTVLWTAHRGDTATMTFQRLKSVVLRPAVRGYLRAGSNQGTAIRDANGEQQIPFANGSVIMFGAREFGFGRGFDQIDIEVFDEAQILTEKALEDMIAATNQSQWIYGALLFYMGTPPRPTDRGEAFSQRRAEALELKLADPVHSGDFAGVVEAGDAVYIECSADSNVGQSGGPGLDDLRQVEKANASFPHRTPLVSIKRLRKNLPGDDSWRREGLGVWDQSVVAQSSISWDRWFALGTDSPPTDGKLAYAVRFSADGARVALGAARRPTSGPPHVELVRVRDMAAGTGWLVEWLTARWRNGRICIDGKAGAGALVNALRDQGVPERVIVTPSVDEVIAAHSMVDEAIKSASLTHFAQEQLDAAVRGAGHRAIGRMGGWGWAPLSPDVDVTPLEVVTLALHTVMTGKRGSGRSGEGRRAVVLG